MRPRAGGPARHGKHRPDRQGPSASRRHVEHGGLARGALRPPLTPRVSAPVSAQRSTGAATGTSSSFAAMAVRRPSAMRRSAIAANPSPAILARFGADCLGVEGAEPLVSLLVATRGMLLSNTSVAQPAPRPSAKTLHIAVWNGGHQAVADKLLGLADGEDDGASRRAFATAALSAARLVFPTPRRPEIVALRRSHGPVGSPKCSWIDRKWPLSPVAGSGQVSVPSPRTAR